MYLCHIYLIVDEVKRCLFWRFSGGGWQEGKNFWNETIDSYQPDSLSKNSGFSDARFQGTTGLL